jgi:hypothetical protein
MSKKKLGLKVLFTASLCLAALATQAQATQYNIDISGTDASVTGIITTDGNLGQLVIADFLSWDLIVKQGAFRTSLLKSIPSLNGSAYNQATITTQLLQPQPACSRISIQPTPPETKHSSWLLRKTALSAWRGL